MKHLPSRTFSLGAAGLLVLALALVVLLACLVWGLASAELVHLVPDILGSLVSVSLALAGVAGGSAVAMGYRDGRSGGLTSSQAAAVIAARRQAAQLETAP